jgi:hypothetical protein
VVLLLLQLLREARPAGASKVALLVLVLLLMLCMVLVLLLMLCMVLVLLLMLCMVRA